MAVSVWLDLYYGTLDNYYQDDGLGSLCTPAATRYPRRSLATINREAAASAKEVDR
jgi:hypothetical protein